eukprot:TRINITY_DN1759_c0_g1_i2.p1 TRINITY_DN1759_c0_g1~~TRINITY_DN1759_c0_g1_i2.p1  ORF type:complete len:576 (+),score=151.00 TRINITY_DN1759_c0_g1_i2:126-1853(+)
MLAYNKLEIIKQDAVAVENGFDGGRQQHVHVVVKNQPFNILISSAGKTFNFQHAQINAKLYYDYNPPKAVDFIQHEPLQYSSTSNNGTDISVEVKISILSSQHQGSLFVVILTITDTVTMESHCIASFPIRIVSKVDHIKKEGGDPVKKKSFNEVLHERLHAMSCAQDDQAKLIEYLLRYRSGEVSAIPPTDLLADDEDGDEDNEHEERVDFQTAFNNIVKSYRNVPSEAEMRAAKVRATLQSLSSTDLEQVAHLVDSLASLSNNPPMSTLDCTCMDCPARREVENFDNLCRLGMSFPNASLASSSSATTATSSTSSTSLSSSSAPTPSLLSSSSSSSTSVTPHTSTPSIVSTPTPISSTPSKMTTTTPPAVSPPILTNPTPSTTSPRPATPIPAPSTPADITSQLLASGQPNLPNGAFPHPMMMPNGFMNPAHMTPAFQQQMYQQFVNMQNMQRRPTAPQGNILEAMQQTFPNGMKMDGQPHGFPMMPMGMPMGMNMPMGMPMMGMPMGMMFPMMGDNAGAFIDPSQAHAGQGQVPEGMMFNPQMMGMPNFEQFQGQMMMVPPSTQPSAMEALH